MNCWHHVVTVTPARQSDRYGDVEVDTAAADEVYREWVAMTPDRATTPDGLRRPLWLARAVRPADSAYRR
jgi:hypothetical protein